MTNAKRDKAAEEYTLKEWPIEDDEGHFILREEYPADFRRRSEADFKAGHDSRNAEVEELWELLEVVITGLKEHRPRLGVLKEIERIRGKQ